MEIECVASLSWRFLLLFRLVLAPNYAKHDRGAKAGGKREYRTQECGNWEMYKSGFAPPVNVDCVVQTPAKK
jgi:hypothetical protein